MERNVQKNGLVNLVAAVMIFIAAFVVTVLCRHSLAGQAGSVFLGLGVLVAFASWFQMRLEENERLEKLEIDELARAKGESSCLKRRNRKFFPRAAPASNSRNFCARVLRCCCSCWKPAARGCSGAGLTGKTTTACADRAMPSLSLFAIFALLLFLLGRFSVTIARLENHRLLRPGRQFSAGGRLCLRLHRAGHRRRQGGSFPRRISGWRAACACCSG
jgi:hypothetical protein